jgi:large subunit ribosomal protein L24
MQITKPVTKPSKQRKAVYQAPNHRRHKLFAASLSSELRASHGTRTFPVRSCDTVRIMRGDHEGFEGKITRVDLAKYRVYVEGLTREKVDGTTIFVPVHPSKVMITNLNLDDKWRKEVLARKKSARKEIEVVEEKPAKRAPEKVAELKEEAVEEKVPVAEKAPEKKPKTTRRKAARKPVAEKKQKPEEEAPKEEKPKVKKPRPKRKTAKTEGGA